MNKQTIEINVPEGFDIAEGEQPRVPVEGDWYWEIDMDETREARSDLHEDRYIILRKIPYEYQAINKRLISSNGECFTIDYISEAKPGRYVEVKALEDALSLAVEKSLDYEEEKLLSTLKTLLPH